MKKKEKKEKKKKKKINPEQQYFETKNNSLQSLMRYEENQKLLNQVKMFKNLKIDDKDRTSCYVDEDWLQNLAMKINKENPQS